MQNRYFGDVGDFGKFGLLRKLCDGTPSLKLGVVWYLTDCGNETKADGKHVGYLEGICHSASKERFRTCDTKLYDVLRQLLVDADGKVVAGRRLVGTVEGERAGVLPDGTVFFSETLKDKEGTSRREWLGRALKTTAEEDLIFLDPDNGIQSQSSRAMGPKHALWSEIEAFAKRGQTVVVYHHLNRSAPHEEQIKLLHGKFKERMPEGFETFYVVFRRGTRRAFFVTAAPPHRDDVASRLSEMLYGEWESVGISCLNSRTPEHRRAVKDGNDDERRIVAVVSLRLLREQHEDTFGAHQGQSAFR